MTNPSYPVVVFDLRHAQHVVAAAFHSRHGRLCLDAIATSEFFFRALAGQDVVIDFQSTSAASTGFIPLVEAVKKHPRLCPDNLHGRAPAMTIPTV